MQNYTEISSATTLQNSLGPLLNNDKTIMSNSSGTVFPTASLQIGMICHRTDLQKIYMLVALTPIWKEIFDLTLTATNKEYVDTGLATKQATLTGAATTIASANLTINRVAIANASGKIAVSGITTTKLNYLTDVTSNIQAQLDGKLATGANAVSATNADKVDNYHAGNASGQVPVSNGVENTNLNAQMWNGSKKTVSTAGPTGGVNGDIWFQREA